MDWKKRWKRTNQGSFLWSLSKSNQWFRKRCCLKELFMDGHTHTHITDKMWSQKLILFCLYVIDELNNKTKKKQKKKNKQKTVSFLCQENGGYLTTLLDILIEHSHIQKKSHTLDCLYRVSKCFHWPSLSSFRRWQSDDIPHPTKGFYTLCKLSPRR